MTLLRTLLISLTLVVFSLPAYSGEVDGKALICGSDDTKGNYRAKKQLVKFISFKDGRVYYHRILKTLPLGIDVYAGTQYHSYPHEIKWGGSLPYTLNRSTLVLKSKWIGNLIIFFNCKIISKEEIKSALEKQLFWMKETMKRNKI